MSASTAIKLVRRLCETGGAEPARIGGYRKTPLSDHGQLLRELTTDKPGITLAEFSEVYFARDRAGLHDDDLVDTSPARPVAQKRA